jgi:hypothetical protein
MKSKAQMAGKATANTGTKEAGSASDEEDEEQPPEPKAKKVKLKVRDEINIAAKQIENKTEGTKRKYGDMIKSMSSTIQARAVGARPLKRQGAIADLDINVVDDQDVTKPSTNHYRYLLLTCTSMPVFDQSTLFYWTLSDASHKKRKYASSISKWASAVPAIAGPTLKPPSSHTNTSRLSRLSVLTDDISHQDSGSSKSLKINSESSKSLKVNSKSASAHPLYVDGGLSDNDEMAGEEREAAINSPVKGKKRVTSEVRLP